MTDIDKKTGPCSLPGIYSQCPDALALSGMVGPTKRTPLSGVAMELHVIATAMVSEQKPDISVVLQWRNRLMELALDVNEGACE